jgi:putative endonuclease
MSAHTANYNITRLVYIESFGTIAEAIDREKRLKGWRRDKKVRLIDAANPEWLDLSSEAF